jgi:hypothetical protein
MALLSKAPRKQAPLNIYLRVLTIGNHPKASAFMRVAGVLQGRRCKAPNLWELPAPLQKKPLCQPPSSGINLPPATFCRFFQKSPQVLPAAAESP